MTIAELIRQLLPKGTTTFTSNVESSTRSSKPEHEISPDWPPDLFAVVASIVERSGCYTQADPDRQDLGTHAKYIKKVESIAAKWNREIFTPPVEVSRLWKILIIEFGTTPVAEVCQHPKLVRCLLQLFAVADEACAGIGWDVEVEEAGARIFASVTFLEITNGDVKNPFLPNLPRSLCVMVPPDRAVVLPKSITSSVGCTIRSLSHFLALLPPYSVIESSWILSSTQRSHVNRPDSSQPYDIRLLLIPFPFTIHATSFELSSKRTPFGKNGHVPAYFKLVQRWLSHEGRLLSGKQIAEELFKPLIQQARAESGWVPNGIVLPECALSPELAEELVAALVDSEIEFLITGVLATDDETGRIYNRAMTFVIRPSEDGAAVGVQNKHHRWRLDRQQTNRYALDFDPDQGNDKWWEDIDVGERKLPFFGLRKDLSLTTLICEDLARTDPAMTAIRAVGPNLVIALLMDGPQLAVRWPGRYATVLAEDPGSAVLSFTCAAMVDRSNWLEAKPARSVGLWRDPGGKTQEIGLPSCSLGILLTIQSAQKHQYTLDNRSDKSQSRQLTLNTIVPLSLAKPPIWI